MAQKLTETPLMKQYEEMKKKHPDAILLFRVGDFYECYKQDAKDAIDILGTDYHVYNTDECGDIVYTSFPHRALDTYLPKLTRAGKRVAICEQLEEKKPKGIAIKQAYNASKLFGVFHTTDGRRLIGRNSDFTEDSDKKDIHGYLNGKPLYEVNEQTALFIQCRKNDTDEKCIAFIKTHIEDYIKAAEILDELAKEDSSILPTPEVCKAAIEEYKQNQKSKQEKKMETKNQTKEINCKLTDEQLRGLGEPDAYFTLTIPKECKTWGKQTDNKDWRPTCCICIEPGNGKIIVTNTLILHTMDVECEGTWPQGDKPFQCFIEPKAISAFAGKQTDIAVWQTGGKVTACETEGARTQSDLTGRYPDYARVIPAEQGCCIKINPDELKRLREFVKANMGKTKQERKNRYAVIHAAKNDADTLQVRVMEYYECDSEAKELASEQFLLSENATHYAQIIFNAELFYYAVQEDFNGQIWIPDVARPAKFLGAMRQSILMPKQVNEIEQYIKD